MEPKGSSSISSDRKTNKTTLASSAHARPNRKSTASSAMVMKPNGKSAVSSAILMKPNASTAPSSAHGDQVMFFRDVSLGPTEADLRFRLIHLWEARNPSTKTLIGQEMILIDEEGTVIQGFVPAGRVGLYELEPGSVYNLRNFFGSRNKAQYRVTDHSATVTFAWNSDLSILDNPPANEGVEADHCVPVPQALLDTIGHTYRFIVKVSDYNLSRKTQTITVTKILPPAAPQPIAASEEHAVPSTSDDILKTGGDRVRQASESLESAEAKRCKSG
ncbi:hypothetical protein YC2023_100340 [Brassica napus]